MFFSCRKFIPYLIVLFIIPASFLIHQNVLADASHASLASECPVGNGPGTTPLGSNGTIECNVSDQYFVNSKCRDTKTYIDPKISSCLTEKNQVYNCYNHTCVCPAGWRDCRGELKPLYNVCLETDLTNDGCATSDQNFRTTNLCTGQCTTSCIPGYEKIGDDCVVACDPVRELRTAEGCLSLEDVEERLTGLEGVACKYDPIAEEFRDAEGNPCEFDPATLEGQVTTTENEIIFIFQILNAILGGDAFEDTNNDGIITIEEIMEQFFENFFSDVTDMQQIIENIQNNLTTITEVLSNITSEIYIDEITQNVIEAATVEFVGITNAKYTTGFPNGYYGANEVCNNATETVDGFDGAGSHVCTAQEILSLYNHNNVPTAGRGWINAGPPGYTAKANDCGGWTKTSNIFLGRYWDFTPQAQYEKGSKGWMRPCNASGVSALSFVCCR